MSVRTVEIKEINGVKVKIEFVEEKDLREVLATATEIVNEHGTILSEADLVHGTIITTHNGETHIVHENELAGIAEIIEGTAGQLVHVGEMTETEIVDHPQNVETTTIDAESVGVENFPDLGDVADDFMIQKVEEHQEDVQGLQGVQEDVKDELEPMQETENSDKEPSNWLTDPQKARLLEIFISCHHSHERCKMKWEQEFPGLKMPGRRTIFRYLNRFRRTGSVKVAKRNRKKSVRTEANITRIREEVAKNPEISVRKLAQAVGLKPTTTREILVRDLKRKIPGSGNKKSKPKSSPKSKVKKETMGASDK